MQTVSLAKGLSVRLRTKWFWVRVQLQSMKGKLSRKRYIRVKNTEKLSKSLLPFVNTLEFFKVFETLSKRNKKCEQTTWVTILIHILPNISRSKVTRK